MDDLRAQAVADMWSGGSGLVARGPKVVLGVKPATASDVERHTGRHPRTLSKLWRVEVGGRFLRSGGLVYPGGVPFPEELRDQTAVIANEVWLYVDDDGEVLGVYWWPDAVRRPIASFPRDEYRADQTMEIGAAPQMFSFPLCLPRSRTWQPAVVVRLSDCEALVFLTQGELPDPLHEMLVLEHGGLSLRVRTEPEPPDVERFTAAHTPPYRRLHAPGRFAYGREAGRSLGPQTWPWPGELHWWTDGVAHELKGFVPLATLQEVAASTAE